MKILKTALTSIALGFSLTAFTAVAQANDNAATNQSGTQQTQQSTADQRVGEGAALTEDQIDRRHEAEMKRCESLSGDEKDICEQQADANRDTAEAESERQTRTSEANRDANKEKKDAQYEVERTKCEAMSGDAQDRCLADVDRRFDR